MRPRSIFPWLCLLLAPGLAIGFVFDPGTNEDRSWGNPDNWEGGEAPGTTVTATIFYGASGSSPDEVTMVLEESRTIRAFYANFLDQNFTHRFDLSNNTLTFDGANDFNLLGIFSGTGESTGTLIMENGYLTGTMRDMRIGDTNNNANKVLNATLDLRDMLGVNLTMRDLRVGTDVGASGEIWFGDGAQIIATRDTRIGQRSGETTHARVHFGENASFQSGLITIDPITEVETITRGNFLMAAVNGWELDSYFVMGEGSSFSAYTTNFNLGSSIHSSTRVAELDLSAVDDVHIDTLGFRIGNGQRSTGTMTTGDRAFVRAANEVMIGWNPISNGTVVLGEESRLEWGTSESPLSILFIGRNESTTQVSFGSLTVGAGSTYEIHTDGFRIGYDDTGRIEVVEGYLNLSASTEGVFHVYGDVLLGAGGRRATGELHLGDNTQQVWGTSEDPIELLVGVVTRSDLSGLREGIWTAGEGGSLHGHVSLLQVGYNIFPANGSPEGTINFSGLGAGELNVATLEIGVGANALGDVQMGGTSLVSNEVTIGSTSNNAKGFLHLNGGLLTVAEELVIDGPNATNQGRLLLDVRNVSGGLHLEELANLEINQGVVEVIFHDPVPFVGFYSGLSWEGDHFLTLQQLIADEKLIYNDWEFLSPEYAGLVELIYSAENDVTLLGFSVIPEPKWVGLLIMGTLTLIASKRRYRNFLAPSKS